MWFTLYKEHRMIKRILIVDDEEGILFSFKGMLEGPSVEVDTACSIDKAESLLKERDYHVALIDVRLRGRVGSDGFKLLEYLKERKLGTETIMITGYGNPESMEKAYLLGAAFYFEKPISLVALQNALESLGVSSHAFGY
jgi:two-component system nitrogen regulation response regulator NtrX